MNNPLISIIVPTYNLENYISETIDSVLAQQDYANFELLIIDDNSTDNTFKIITDYAGKDSRIKVFLNKRSKGVSGARNTGLENAQGEWITFLDGDDLWDERILVTQIDVLKKYPDVQLISSNFYILNEFNTKVLQTDEYPIWNKYFNQANQTGELLCLKNLASCFLEDSVLTRTGIFLIKAELFTHVGFFDENLILWEDQLLWIQLARQASYMVYIPKPLMIYRYRHGSLTRHGVLVSKYAVIGLKKLLRAKEFKVYKDKIIKQIGSYTLENTYSYRKKGQKLKAIFSAADGVIYEPYKLITWKNLLATLLLI